MVPRATENQTEAGRLQGASDGEESVDWFGLVSGGAEASGGGRVTVHNYSDGFGLRSPDPIIISVCRRPAIQSIFHAGDIDENSVTKPAIYLVSVVQAH